MQASCYDFGNLVQFSKVTLSDQSQAFRGKKTLQLVAFGPDVEAEDIERYYPDP